jgi:hypothetical protein
MYFTSPTIFTMWQCGEYDNSSIHWSVEKNVLLRKFTMKHLTHYLCVSFAVSGKCSLLYCDVPNKCSLLKLCQASALSLCNMKCSPPLCCSKQMLPFLMLFQVFPFLALCQVSTISFLMLCHVSALSFVTYHTSIVWKCYDQLNDY